MGILRYREAPPLVLPSSFDEISILLSRPGPGRTGTASRARMRSLDGSRTREVVEQELTCPLACQGRVKSRFKPKRKLKNMPLNKRGEALPKFYKCLQS